jgi:triphosphoribosyl-dephospho-CoA synthetase
MKWVVGAVGVLLLLVGWALALGLVDLGDDPQLVEARRTIDSQVRTIDSQVRVIESLQAERAGLLRDVQELTVATEPAPEAAAQLPRRRILTFDEGVTLSLDQTVAFVNALMAEARRRSASGESVFGCLETVTFDGGDGLSQCISSIADTFLIRP